MNKGSFFLALFLILATSGIVVAQQKAIKVGEHFGSPDGRLDLKCVVADDSDASVIGGISISDKKQTGQLFKDSTDSVIYNVKWTDDSRSVVLIENLHGGSVAQVYHLKENGWVSFTADPLKGDNYEVIDEVVGKNRIKLKYKVHDRSEDRFLVYTFTFDPETITRSDESEKVISFDAYQKLKPRLN